MCDSQDSRQRSQTMKHRPCCYRFISSSKWAMLYVRYPCTTGYLYLDNGILEQADAFDLRLDYVPGFEKFGGVTGETHAAGRAGGNDISWLKGQNVGEESNDLAHRDDHIAGV